MTKEKLSASIAEAKRFLAIADKCQKANPEWNYFIGTKESGAVRRASMDLTRSLAELRKSN